MTPEDKYHGKGRPDPEKKAKDSPGYHVFVAGDEPAGET
jgi:hypothetical protein